MPRPKLTAVSSSRTLSRDVRAEVVQHEHTGLGVDPDNAYAYAEARKTLLDPLGWRAQMGAAGHVRHAETRIGSEEGIP
jgi:hypothetical protein